MKITPLAKMKPKSSRPLRTPERSYLVADLRGIRTKHGIGVREAAKASGISPATISRMEMGFSPDIGTALKASIFYGLPVQGIWKLP